MLSKNDYTVRRRKCQHLWFFLWRCAGFVCGGVPTFKQVMDAVLAETEVEAYTIANEIEEKNPELLAYIQQSLPEAEESRIDHVDLKKMSAQCKFAIRTGEFTPYPNIILRAGVAFPA